MGRCGGGGEEASQLEGWSSARLGPGRELDGRRESRIEMGTPSRRTHRASKGGAANLNAAVTAITLVALQMAMLLMLMGPEKTLLVAAAGDWVDPASEKPVWSDCPWQLVWSDEFNGNKLNTKKWKMDSNCWGGGNGEYQCYTKRSKNVSVKNGKLRLTPLKEPYTTNGNDCTCNTEPCMSSCGGSRDYTSGKIMMKQGFKYGRVSVRAKLPKGCGLWPAIWMMPTSDKYGTWAASGEVDIMEARGCYPDQVQGTFFYGGQWPAQQSSTSLMTKFSCVKDFSDDFHVYSLEWGKNDLLWLVDGSPFYRQSLQRYFGTIYGKKRAPFDQPFYILLNVAVGGGFLWGTPFNNNWQQPAMEIDFVRVYQRSDTLASTVYDNGAQIAKCFNKVLGMAGNALGPGWPAPQKRTKCVKPPARRRSNRRNARSLLRDDDAAAAAAAAAEEENATPQAISLPDATGRPAVEAEITHIVEMDWARGQVVGKPFVKPRPGSFRRGGGIRAASGVRSTGSQGRKVRRKERAEERGMGSKAKGKRRGSKQPGTGEKVLKQRVEAKRTVNVGRRRQRRLRSMRR